MTKSFIRLQLLGLILLSSCGTLSQETRNGSSAPLSIDATVIEVPVEGSFFGLIADDGRRYDPGSLPPDFRIDGLKVRATLRRQPEMMTTRMWGERVELLHLERR